MLTPWVDRIAQAHGKRWLLPQSRSPVIIHLSASHEPPTHYSQIRNLTYWLGVLECSGRVLFKTQARVHRGVFGLQGLGKSRNGHPDRLGRYGRAGSPAAWCRTM